MKVNLEFGGVTRGVDLNNPIDLSLAIAADGPKAWYVSPPQFEVVKDGNYVGSVKDGGSVNFRNIIFNPHGHGTHTECVGHIAEEVFSVNKTLQKFFYFAYLWSVEPVEKDGDRVITFDQIKALDFNEETEAFIIRTLPNSNDKKTINYSSTNPPYIEKEAIAFLVEKGIKHLLLDLPSVDRENDEGKLEGHHAFWTHPHNTRFDATITEMIFIPDSVTDDYYLLELQCAAFENDAAPSRPILYKFQ